MKFSRSKPMQAGGASPVAPLAANLLSAEQVPAAPKEGSGTPRIALGMGDGGGAGRGATPADRRPAARRIKQLGVDHVLSGGPAALPWTAESLATVIDPWKAAGVSV